MRATFVLVAFFAVTSCARDFVVGVVNAGEGGALFAVFTRVIDLIAASAFFLMVREPVGAIITRALSEDATQPAPTVRLLSRFWPAPYIALFVLQVITEARGYLSGTLGKNAAALKRSFAVFVIAPFLVAAVGIWRDQVLVRTERQNKGRVAGLFSIREGGLTVGAAIAILYTWDIDPFATDLEGAQRILPGLVSAAIVTVIGLAAWRTLSGFLTGEADTPADDCDGVPDGEGGAGGSRIDTVLPILRITVAVLIGTVTVLLALSSLGVQIAPLLAGAGILGLAVGFGAQKIVEDIISGVLYLLEDAFRNGEYIETNQGKGVVEAIMLRSVRLRHHLGPVFTVPFSSMGTIKNNSRDWVTVKLSFEVAPTQDLEKVRKLVKKVSAQLMDDPELDGQFLAPLKSQGAFDLVGSNYKIGVKFTSKPGEQFLIRSKARRRRRRRCGQRGGSASGSASRAACCIAFTPCRKPCIRRCPMSDRLLLTLAAIGLVPIALAYGLVPSVTLPYLLGFPVEGTHLTHIFRAIIGPYPANVALWVAGAFGPSLARPALWTLFIFMAGLAGGRLLSLLVDGLPNVVLLFYLAAEIAFAIMAAFNLKKRNAA